MLELLVLFVPLLITRLQMTFWSAFKPFLAFSSKPWIICSHLCFIFLQVVSGDLVSVVPPGALAAAHI
jgi:hypothetical protein